MVRSGRLTAADLGLGTLTNINITATRRVFAILTGTLGSQGGGSGGTFTQGETLMSAIKGVWVTIWDEAEDKATGSVSWNITNIDGGSFVVWGGAGLNKKVVFRALVVGTPDELSIV